MSTQGENSGKAVEGNARAQLLSPERRSEIARLAARKRWSNHSASTTDGTIRKPMNQKMLKGVSRFKRLTVTESNQGSDKTKISVITDGSNVLRIYSGTPESVDASVKSYIEALEDIGIEVELSMTSPGKLNQNGK